jgi:hypothetical protein
MIPGTLSYFDPRFLVFRLSLNCLMAADKEYLTTTLPYRLKI